MGRDGGTPQGDPFIGQTIAKRFKVVRLIGEGGIGRVYLARQVRLGRDCALKVLHPHFAARADMARRFQREAHAASMLNHPNSVTVFDFGAWHGRLYIAMELLQGRPLDELIVREHPLADERIVDLMVQLCSVLTVAHRAELLHRDLKPENIVVVRDASGCEQVKVVDFGLAVVMQDKANPRLTQDGSVSGTPAYMSPEQALDKKLDQRSDLYAAGCILYELLTGSPPFRAASPVECLAMHLYDEPDTPTARARNPVNKALEATALWCLEKKPEHRPQSADELKVALLEALERPGESEALRRAAEMTAMNRLARAKAAGITETRREERPATRLGFDVLLFESTDAGPDTARVLRAQGCECRTVGALDVPPALEDGAVDGVVVDIRNREGAALDALAWWLESEALGKRPVIVVGPDGDFSAMTRALEVGAADYVPEGDLTKLGKKLSRAVRRGRRSV